MEELRSSLDQRLVQRGWQNVIAEYAYTPAAGAASATETLARTYVNGTQYIDERIVMRNHTVNLRPTPS